MTIIPACATGAGIPQLSCFLELGVSVSNWILGITGSLALLFFVYGGFLFLTSRGNTEQVAKGKTVLTQAAIGIIIIFGAYIGVSFLVKAIGGKFTAEFKIEQPVAPTTPKTPTSPDEKPIAKMQYQCFCVIKEFSTDKPPQISYTEKFMTAYATLKECDDKCTGLCQQYANKECKLIK